VLLIGFPVEDSVPPQLPDWMEIHSIEGALFAGKTYPLLAMDEATELEAHFQSIFRKLSMPEIPLTLYPFLHESL